MSRRVSTSTNLGRYYRKQIRPDPPKIVDPEYQYHKEKEYLQLFIDRHHHHIVRAAFFEDSSLTIVFHRAPWTLRDYILGEGVRLPTLYNYLRTSFAQLASGLAHIHGMHITHNDLKPENVLVTGQGTMQITDFGSASYMNEDGFQVENVRDSLGDRRYLTPDEYPYGYPRDIWALSLMFIQVMNTRLGLPSRQFNQTVYSPSYDIIPDQLWGWVNALRNHRGASREDNLILWIANRGLDENPMARPSATEIFNEIRRDAPNYIEDCCN